MAAAAALVMTMNIGALAGEEESADFTAFEEAVQAFMAEHEIAAATFAISMHGGLVHSGAYGFCDAGGTTPATPRTPMRMASVSKPIAAAVVRSLIAEGELTLETPVFETLGMNPLPDGADERLARITVGHLLDHRGGWDRQKSGDPMFRDAEIKAALGIEHAPTADDIIRFMLTQPLDFDPGERSAYSNFGYCLLGRVVEAVTGEAFIEVVRRRIGEPLEMPSLALGRTFAEDRSADEVHYPIADGSLHVERMDAHGGLIANAPDLLRFARAYWISGEPRASDGNGKPANGRTYAFFGAMPGTVALLRQRSDGIDYAVLMNRWPRRHYRQLLDRLDAAVDQGRQE